MSAPVVQRVAVVDDDRPVLVSVVEMLSIAGFDATGYACPVDFLRALPALEPCCVVTDVRMPRISGLTLIERMKSLGYGHWPVIVISGHADVPMAVAAMQLGARTVLEKPFRPDQLIEAIKTGLDPKQEPGRAYPSSADARARYETLSPREKEVLSHAVLGKSSKAAAAEMGLSPRTVETFRASILRKMSAPNFTALARMMGSDPASS